MIKHIVFIDSRVTNYPALVNQLDAGSEWILLDADRDGVHQVQVALADRQDLDSIRIIAHGRPGAFVIGATELSEGTLADYAIGLSCIGQALGVDGDVQIYACEVGQGHVGREFVRALSDAIGAYVAAASSPVGHAELGGRWVLDVGKVATKPLKMSQWHDVLGLIITPSTQLYPDRSAGEFSNLHAFAALRSDGSVVSWGNPLFGGDSSAVATELDGTIDVTQVFSGYLAFAALRADGSVVTWGHVDSGGDSTAVATELDGTIDVTEVFSTSDAFAALRADGSVVTWGRPDHGGDSTAVATELDGTIDITQVFSNRIAFAALRVDGSVVTWGNSFGGGDSSAVAPELDGTIDVIQVCSNSLAFAALRTDGSLVTWGEGLGGNSDAIRLYLDGTIDVTQVCSSDNAFAALRADGSVVTWGQEDFGGDQGAVFGALDGTIDVTKVSATHSAFAALRTDGSVVTWGYGSNGGDSSTVATALDGSIDVTRVFSNDYAFAALRADGSIVTWGNTYFGGNSGAVAAALDGTIDVKQVYSNDYAFAALRADGSVVTWGSAFYGGDSSAVAGALDGTIDVTQVFSTYRAFAALRADGSVVTWGDSSYGGDSTSVASLLTDVVSMANPFTDDVYTAPNMTGESLVQEARQHLGQEYVWGATPGQAAYATADYVGPWDCSEFVSWCVNKAYGKQIGLDDWNAYTGYWADDANAGTQLSFITLATARDTAGAILYRFDNGLHHIAISEGNGMLIEANVNYHGGYYWSDDGTRYSPLTNGLPPAGVDIGDVRESVFDLGTYNEASGWKAVEIDGVAYTTIPVVLPPGIDDFSAGVDTTGTLSLATTATGQLETAGDKDWFKIDNLIAGHSYQILVTGYGDTPLSDTFFSVRDAAGERVTGSSSRLGGQAYDDAGDGRDALVQFTVTQSGTHYVAVGGGGANYADLTGGYQVTLSEVTEPGSTLASASTIDLNAGPQQGFVGYGADTADYYTFTAPDAGQVSIELTGLGADLDASLLNASGSLLVAAGDTLSACLVGGQTYYVKVAPHGSGDFAPQSPYQIDVNFVAATELDAKTAEYLFQTNGGEFATLADFAMGAYRVMPWEPSVSGMNDIKPGAEQAYGQVIGSGKWTALDSSDLDLPSSPSVCIEDFATGISDGLYTNENAAALVAVSDNAMVISFRGTNDTSGEFPTPDVEHWVPSSLHYDLLADFVRATNVYVENHNNIEKIYVVGHSLGAAMVNAYMEDHGDWTRDNGSAVTYEGVTFADPGYFLVDSENRITNFLSDSDVINAADVLRATPGDDNNLDDDLLAPVQSHGMGLYQAVMTFLHEEGVQEDEITGDGLINAVDYDNFVYHVEEYIPSPGTYVAGLGNNTLDGSIFGDILLGGEGNDTLDGGWGNDVLYGGLGNDTYWYDSGDGNDAIVDRGGNDTINIGTGFLNVSTTLQYNGDVKIVLTGSGGSFSSLTVKGYSEPDCKLESIVWNGWSSGYCTITALLEAHVVANPSLPQLIVETGVGIYQAVQSFDAAAYIDLLQGKVEYVAKKAISWLGLGEAFAAFDEDSIVGKQQTISGFRDVIGSDGDDRIFGDNNANVLSGEAGNDLVHARGGDDFILGGAGNDTYDGGDGLDTLVYSSTTLGIVVNLTSSSDQASGSEIGTDQIVAVENIVAGLGNDTLTGNRLANMLSGDAGNDTLDGGTGIDTLVGGDGNDLYYVRDVGDVVSETNATAGTGGTDTVYSYLTSYTLGANVENGRIVTSAVAKLTGNTLDNLLYAGAGNNVLAGGAGSDSVSFYYGVASGVTTGVTVTLTNGSGTATGGSGTDTLTGIEHLYGTNNADKFTGDANANTLYGYAGNDTLDGGAGIDSMVGGDGNDLYYVRNTGDSVSETNAASTGGIDTVYSYLSTYTLGDNVENARIVTTAASNLTGNTLNNVIYAGAGNNTLAGGDGIDTLSYAYGLSGTNGVTVSLAIATGQTTGGSGLDTISGFENLTGSSKNDRLTGSSDNNILDGGTGIDTMVGGDGNDLYYVRDVGDVVSETNATAGTGGTDTVYSYLTSYTLGANVENGRIVTSAVAKLTGNTLDNLLYAGAGNNVLAGGAGSDSVSFYYGVASGVTTGVTVTLTNGSGTATGGSGTDTLTGIEHLYGTNNADKFTGDANANTLYGYAGNDTLDGGAGIDSMVGGDGNDLYYVRNTGDSVSETNAASTGGIDTVYSYLSTYTLGDNVENARIVTTAASNLTGNTLNNVIYAGAGNNTLAGGDGIDTLSYAYGLSGTNGVTVSLAIATGQTTGGSGLDTISGFENLTGSSKNDRLTGSSDNNILDGGTGIDTMVGGDGNDLYYVRDVGDVVSETNATAGTGGTDTVYSYLTSYTLGANVENGRIVTSAVAKLTGNTLDNLLYAGAGNNVLAGGAGSDSVSFYYGVASGVTTGVTVTLTNGSGTATGGSGTDTLTGIEHLYGTNNADKFTGDANANTLYGYAGNDTLDGGAGIDSMVGGDGNDLYYVRNTGDSVSETNAASTGGIDTVYSYLSTYTLGDNVENARIVTTAASNLTGNTLNNVIYAGAGNNTLAGGDGIDTLSYAYGLSGTNGVTVSLAIATGQTTGGSGLDTISGFENLTGSSKNDRLTGSSDNNILDGGTGIDTMVGGDGNDLYYVRDVGDVVSETNATAGTGGTDTVYSHLTSYTLGANVENGRIVTSAVAKLTGNTLDNLLYAGAGNNVLAGGAGSDSVSFYYGVASGVTTGVTVTLTNGSGTATGGSGTDTLTGIEHLYGTNNADKFTGDVNANTLYGYAGNDTLDGGAGIDTLVGGDGNDLYYVRDTGDSVSETNAASSGGIDTVYSYLNTYTLGDNVENARIVTTAASNLTGNTLNNVIYAGAGNNTLAGGDGIDTLSYAYGLSGTSGVTVSLAVVTGQTTGGSGLDTISGFENLTGSSKNDTLAGNSDNNVLTGGLGKDTLTGNGGNDIFDFNTLAEMGITSTTWDTITDFNLGDRIDLSSLDANTGTTTVNDAFSTIKVGGAFSGTFGTGAGTLYFDATKNVLYGNTDADSAAEFAIKLTGVTSVSSVDFIL